jgi:ABC-type sugar transport system ATPase subunit
MKTVRLENVSVSFDKVPFIKNMSVTFEGKKFHVILGYSGTGKTTMLRIIAGLQKIDSGKIYFDDIEVQGFSPNQRKVGYVPQDYILFPSLNVFDNIAFGLDRKKLGKKVIETKVKGISQDLGIEAILPRKIDGLSGGEKQRVALARAMIIRPNILLLDEPLSAIDTGERLRLSLLIKRVTNKYQTTTFYITHSSSEAELLSDQIVIIDNGKIAVQGNFKSIKEKVSSQHVAQILGIPNVYNISNLSSDFLSKFNYKKFQKENIIIILPENIEVSSDGNIKAEVIQNNENLSFVIIEDKIFTIKKAEVNPGEIIKVRIND